MFVNVLVFPVVYGLCPLEDVQYYEHFVAQTFQLLLEIR